MPQKQEQMFWKICVSLYFTKTQKSDRRTHVFLKLLRDVIKTLMLTVDWLIDPCLSITLTVLQIVYLSGCTVVIPYFYETPY